MKHELQCEYCQKSFLSSHATARFCCNAHRVAAARKRKQKTSLTQFSPEALYKTAVDDAVAARFTAIKAVEKANLLEAIAKKLKPEIPQLI